MGKRKKEITGYNYNGTFAQFIGIGPAYSLHKIENGDTVVWEGSLDNTYADGDGKSVLTTSLGTMHFYWGLPSQNPSATLEGLFLDQGVGAEAVPMPAYRNIIYVVCLDCAFGNQTVPPTLQFTLTRFPDPLTISAHAINGLGGSSIIPEIIYDLLTDTLFGRGIPESEINKASFEAAGNTLIDEGIGADVELDDTSNAREFIGKLMDYCDGLLYYEAGQIHCKLLRNDFNPASLASITEDHLLEEPTPRNELWDSTWNLTRLLFRDASNKWEETTELFDDPANAAIQGQRVEREFNLPWITDREIAKIVAKRKGIQGGIPKMFYTLLLPPSFRTVLPGDCVKLTYAKLGFDETVMRVMDRTLSGSLDGQVTLECRIEQSRNEENDFIVGTDTLNTPPVIDSSGTGDFEITPASPRLMVIPDELKQGYADGLLVAVNRTDPLISGASIHFTFDPIQSEYRQVLAVSNFPASGTLKWWTRIRGTHWLVRIQFATTDDHETVNGLAQAGADILIAAGYRARKTTGSIQDAHSINGMWFRRVEGGYIEIGADRVVTMEAAAGVFTTTIPAYETASVPANNPTAAIYAGRETDFAIIRSDTLAFEQDLPNSPASWGGSGGLDSAYERLIKVTLENQKGAEELADVTAAEFRRHDTTMSASGTYDPDWGASALSLAEMLDLVAGREFFGVTDANDDFTADIDAALAAIFFNASTEGQFLAGDDADTVLGSVAARALNIYTNTP